MSEVNGCHLYNPCSWFRCCYGDDEKGSKEPLVKTKTPEQQKRSVSTAENTPTKPTQIQAETVTLDQKWE